MTKCKQTQHQKGLYQEVYEHDACGVGMVVNIHGNKSHQLVDDALHVLENMRHRGAEVGNDGDGAGIMLQIPHEFILLQGIPVPEKGKYGTGLVFLPKNEKVQQEILSVMIEEIEREGLQLMHLRTVPTNPECLGNAARNTEPDIKQVFALHLRAMSFERMAKLNQHEVLRTLPHYQAEVRVREELLSADTRFRWDLLWSNDKLTRFEETFSYRWVVISEEIGVSAVAMIPPLTAVREDRYMTAHHHKDGFYDIARPSFSLSVVPVQSMTHVVMCWHRDDADYVAPWKNDLCSGDNARLASFLNRCIFAKSEDYYIRPSLWNALSPAVQELVALNLCCNDIGLDVPEVIVLDNRRHIG